MNKGKYVFAQIMEFAPFYDFDQCVKRYRGHHYIKSFTCWQQFLSMAFGQLAYRESLRDVVVCLRAQKTKLYHSGFSSLPAKTTLARANEKRDWRIYRDFAQILIQEARRLYLDDTVFNLDLDSTCYVLDATTIELCFSVFQWARYFETKAAVRLHTLMDLKGNIPAFFRITTAKTHEVNMLDIINLEVGAYYVMDRGFLSFERLFKIHTAGSFFVIRAKKNLRIKRLYSNKVDKTTGVRCDQVIISSHRYGLKKYPDKLRRIKYFDKETKRSYVYLTNDFNIEAKTVADLYKNRWQIEIFFKWIKQHLKIKAFWGYSANAVKTQICIAICAYLMVAIIKKKLNIDRNLYEILQILSVSLFDKIPINTLLSEVSIQNLAEHNQEPLFPLGF
ncbi:MAG: IS4 family transposase [Parcubacteria group bacterium]|nr:IS4 family transposase [Parcubacteria group bacterium]